MDETYGRWPRVFLVAELCQGENDAGRDQAIISEELPPAFIEPTREQPERRKAREKAAHHSEETRLQEG